MAHQQEREAPSCHLVGRGREANSVAVVMPVYEDE